jgi:hypothetical protein
LTKIICSLLLVAGCRRFEPGRFLNEHPDVARCKEAAALSEIATWRGGKIQVRHASRASPVCPGPGFPFVAAYAEGPARWIQIVEVNVPTPGDLQHDRRRSLNGRTFPWLFVDVDERLRAKDEPFVNGSSGGDFWDNPVWAALPPRDQADGVRRWRARSYLVLVDDRTIRAGGGFAWGWSWRVGELAPEALPLIPLGEASWNNDKPLLIAAFPDWKFL